MEKGRIESKHNVLLPEGMRKDSRNICRLLTCEGDLGKGLGSKVIIVSYTGFLLSLIWITRTKGLI